MASSPELEAVLDGEIVEERVPWEQIVSEWTEGASEELAGQLRQARAAGTVARDYGRSSMEAFAKDVGCSRSKVYSYARVWQTYGHLVGTESFSRRLESGRLSISHMIEGTQYPEPVAAIDRAEDEGISARQMERERKEETVPGNVEVVEMARCSHCQKAFELSRASTWTEEI
jgi:hypothetical protein